MIVRQGFPIWQPMRTQQRRKPCQFSGQPLGILRVRRNDKYGLLFSDGQGCKLAGEASKKEGVGRAVWEHRGNREMNRKCNCAGGGNIGSGGHIGAATALTMQEWLQCKGQIGT